MQMRAELDKAIDEVERRLAEANKEELKKATGRMWKTIERLQNALSNSAGANVTIGQMRDMNIEGNFAYMRMLGGKLIRDIATCEWGSC